MLAACSSHFHGMPSPIVPVPSELYLTVGANRAPFRLLNPALHCGSGQPLDGKVTAAANSRMLRFVLLPGLARATRRDSTDQCCRRSGVHSLAAVI